MIQYISHSRFKFTFFLIVITSLIPCVPAQTKNVNEFKEFPTSCEEGIIRFAQVMEKNIERRNKEAALIMVLRLGTSEKEKVQERRKETFKNYLQVLKPSFDVLLVSGERLSDLGKLEFYVEGIKLDEIRFIKNQVLDLEKCAIF